jgi:hypothetical protein
MTAEEGPILRSIYENVSKNNLFAMFVRVNLFMIVPTYLPTYLSSFFQGWCFQQL